MRVTASELLQRLPGPASEKWPTGERFASAMSHGSMSVELYAPFTSDPQTPHVQDELYFIISGTGVLAICSVPCDHVPIRSWPLFRACDLMRGVIESFKREQRL